MISKKHKNLCITLIYFEHFLVLQSTITGCVSISTGITISAIGSKISAITTGIEKYKTIIKKKKKKHDKIVLLAKSKLSRIEVIVSKALINSVISHDELVSINNLLKQYDEMKEKIKNLKTQIVPQIFYLFIKQCYCIVWSAEVIQKVRIQNFQWQKTEQ